MSNTYKHKDQAKSRRNLLKNIPVNLKMYWNRLNYDKGESFELRTKIKEKILDNEMYNELNE